MNAFEYAMKMEIDGKAYYSEQATKVDDPALTKIFKELAGDEERHYQIFKAMAEGRAEGYISSAGTHIFESVRNIFQEMKDAHQEIAEFSPGIKEAWEKAREIEEKSESFYREQAEKTDDGDQKKTWNRIADEEHKHWVTINNVVDFINRPNQWLEDAEWSNLEPY